VAKSNLSGAGIPIVLEDYNEDGEHVGELSLTVTPLTDRDIDHLDEWLRVMYLRAVRKSLREEEDITEAERAAELSLAHAAAATLSWMSGRGATMMATPRGIAKLLHTHCRVIDRTPEELRMLCLHPVNIDRINEVVSQVNISNFKSEKLAALAVKREAEEQRNKELGKSKQRKRKRRKKKKRK